MVSCLSVDFERVTVTFQSKDRAVVARLLGGALERSRLYEGWITHDNPSPCPIGFAVFFRESRIFADFHNIPFYYGQDWKGYFDNVARVVFAHPEGSRFTQQSCGFEFEAGDLPLFVEILGGGPPGQPPPVVALARVDFEDHFYSLIRVIDGDTIVVQPPPRLSDSMKDIHVRLYGLETPELPTALGPRYRDHLDDLCRVDAGGKLMIVWERERLGTNYEGYPRVSFEREIGHIFFQTAQREYLYINGLMHLLPHCSLERNGRSLLRGCKVLARRQLSLPFDGHCMSTLFDDFAARSDTLRRVFDMRPPRCLLSLTKVPSLDPRPIGVPSAPDIASLVIKETGCPFDSFLRELFRQLRIDIESQRMSPFDVPLSLLSMWAQGKQVAEVHN